MKKIIFILMILFLSILYCADGDIAELVSFEPGEVIFFTTTGLYSGSLNGRTLTDQHCIDTYNANYINLNKTNIRAVISVDSSDCIVNMPKNYDFSPLAVVKGPTADGIVIAESWSQLFNAVSVPLKKSLFDAGVTAADTDKFWTGSDYYGQLLADKYCINWTENTSAGWGTFGAASSTGQTWISDGTGSSCMDSYRVLCAAW